MLTKGAATAGLGMTLIAAFAPAFAADCERKSGSISEFRYCLGKQSDLAVDDAYNNLHLRLKAKNAKVAALLQQSQLSWQEFVERSCAFQQEFNPDGMIPADAAVSCRVDFGHARVRVLTAWGRQF